MVIGHICSNQKMLNRKSLNSILISAFIVNDVQLDYINELSNTKKISNSIFALIK